VQRRARQVFDNPAQGPVLRYNASAPNSGQVGRIDDPAWQADFKANIQNLVDRFLAEVTAAVLLVAGRRDRTAHVHRLFGAGELPCARPASFYAVLPRIDVLLQFAVEVLMGPYVQDFDDPPLGIELVREQ